MSDLSAPGHPHVSLSRNIFAWWDGHTRERQRMLRFWAGLAGGLTAMTILCFALRAMA